MAEIRLDKFLADAGAGTRSTVKIMVKKGRVSVNGEIVKKSDIKVNPEKDVICLDGKKLTYNEFEFFMLNKPQGVISATTDTKDKTVIELITEAKRRDLFPVGRLDKDTEGLLIITNDGKLANNLLAPGKHVEKKYFARVEGLVTDETVKLFEEGLDIGDEKITAPAKLFIKNVNSNDNTEIENGVEKEIFQTVSEIEIIITEGRYHQVKRMFEAVGMKVSYLKRLSMGKLFLDESLKPGEYRRLTEDEIKLLSDNS